MPRSVTDPARRSRLRQAVLVGALVGYGGSAHAGFLQPEGAGQLILGSGISSFSRSFDTAGRLARSAAFSKASLYLSGSYGLSDRVTLVGSGAFDQLQPRYLGDPGGQTSWSGLAGARLPLWRGERTILSLQAMAGAGQEGGRVGAMADTRLLLGHGFSLAEWPAFAEVQAGYRHGAPGARAEWRLDATLGVRPHPDWLVLVQAFGAEALPSRGQPGATRLKLALSAVWRWSPRWSVQLGGFVTPLGRNAAAESGLTLALWRDF